MIRRAAPYILFIGLTCIVVDGLWIVEHYDTYVTYPAEAFIYLILGLSLTLAAHLIILLGQSQVTPNGINSKAEGGKNHRVFLQKVWADGEKLANRAFLILLVFFILLAIYDFGLAIRLLNPVIFIGMTGYWFLEIVQEETEDQVTADLEPKSRRVQDLLKRIDYRRHPFSIPLILFTLIVFTFLLSKQFGFTLGLETSGNPYYVMSLPSGTFITGGFVFACGFIYIFQHGDFLGIRQAKQSDYKVMRIHFFEIIICGSTFFIWLLILVVALFTSY